MDEYATWIVERVLEYGQMQDVLGLAAFYGRQRFLEIVAQASRLSEKTSVFWASVLKKEGMTCTRKYSRPTAWNY
ncbi:MAG: hypothetical protein JXB04_12735 [Kiritimatiellae bacterium]|nr:hypothetical protein [Kiritimatiellia bacterium]